MPFTSAAENIAQTVVDAARTSAHKVSMDMTGAVDSARASRYAVSETPYAPYLSGTPATSSSSVHKLSVPTGKRPVQESFVIQAASAVQSRNSVALNEPVVRAAGSTQEEIHKSISKNKPWYQRQDFWLNARFWAYGGPILAALIFFTPFMAYGLHALSERGKKK